MATIAQNTITLIRVNDGANGSTISSITREYYLSNSKTSQTGGRWTTTAPAWQYGKYLWTRYKIVYTNPSKTEYTTAYCDSSWEAIDEIQIGGRNLVLNSNNGGNGWSNSNYQIATNLFLSPYSSDKTDRNDHPILVEGETYTLSYKMKVVSGEGIQWVGAYWSGNISIGSDYNVVFDEDHVYTRTFVANHTRSDGTVLGNLNLYVGPSSATRGVNTLYWVKIEKGNKATDWTPAPEDTAATIDDINDQLAGMDNIITNTQTNFEQKIDSITATVQQTQQAQIEYENQLVDIRKDISSEIQQVADGINITIEELYTQFGDLGDATETIRTFFKVTSDGLAIAQDGNPTSTLMGYDHFAILVNEEEVVKVFQDSIDAPNAFFHNSLRVGNIKFTAYTDGVAITWAGD